MDLRHDYGCDKNEKDICTCGADDVYHQKARIAELEAEVARLTQVLVNEVQTAYEDGSVVGWNDALDAAVESVLKKLYLLSIGTPEEGPFTKQDRTRDEVIEQAVESIRALRR